MLKNIIALTLSLVLSTAFAHATVRTEAGLTESVAGKSETYRLNIPVEKDLATTQVRLIVPTGVAISRFQVSPSFTRRVIKNDVGLVTEVIWRGRIAPMEYARFFFQATNPKDVGELVWNIYQTYSDGTVVAWDDSDPAKTPASRTVVK